MINNKIGDIIKYFRIKNNMSQNELATMIGINRSELSKIENGVRKTINKQILKRICNILNVNYTKLVQKSETNNGEKSLKKYEVTITETFKTKYIVSADNEESAIDIVENFYNLADTLNCKITKECEVFSKINTKEIKENNISSEDNNYIAFDEIAFLL